MTNLIDEQTEKNVGAITVNLQKTYRLNPAFTFENFSQGKENEFACTMGMRTANEPGNPLHNPLYIYGEAGVGKTHLMQAIGAQALVRNPGARIQYMHSEMLVSKVVHAYQNYKFDDFRRQFQTLDLLLIDDINFLDGMTRTQLELVQIIDTLLDNGKQLVVTSHGENCVLDGFSATLRDRLAAGLNLRLACPGTDLRVAILRTKATQVNFSLNEDVALFISENSGASVRQLEGALKRVIAYSRFNEKSSTERPITLSLAIEALG